MFTGIIEEQGRLISVEPRGSNLDLWIEAAMAPELRPDQSVAHDGICLTVVEVNGLTYRVSLVEQTLNQTTARGWQPGYMLNLERALRLGDRLDGHWVQGHVDGTARCLDRWDRRGSHEYRFEVDPAFAPLIIEKGSVCLSGVSLTAHDLEANQFSVSLIPYTYAHTNLRHVDPGGEVNIELDIIGKYLARARAWFEGGGVDNLQNSPGTDQKARWPF